MMKNYHPNSIEELCAALSELTPAGKIISGGTDLIIRLHSGNLTPDALLYMGGVEDCKKIERVGDTVEIGAACTMTAIEECSLLQGALGALPDAACDVGSVQIRNNGTIGGNIANASPAGDLQPVLFLLEAQVVIAGPSGLRTAPIAEVITGPGKTTLAHNEAIVKFIVAVPAGKSAFVKLGFRGKVTISRIGMAVLLEQDSAGTVVCAKMMAGAISLTPVRVPEAEAAILGTRLGDDAIAKAGQAVSDLILKITPEKFDRDYKVWSAKGVVEDVLKKFSGTP